MNTARCCAVVIASLLAANAITCAAHEDTPLRRDPDGRLHGLPAQYAPASLKIGYANHDNTQRITSLTLQVREHRIALPECLLRDIKTRHEQNVHAEASWYHHTQFPPYIDIVISKPYTRQEDWPEGEESFTFNLDTGKLLRYTHHEKTWRLRFFWVEQGMRYVPVDVRKLCSAKALNGLLDSRYTVD